MNDRETPAEYKDKHQLIFVGMFWRDDTDPIYKDWTEGRIEIRTWDDVHCNNEIRFCTKKTDEWIAFQEKFNCKWLTEEELEEFKEIVREKYKQSPSLS